MTRFQRARKPEEKAHRRAAILRAARAVAGEVGPAGISLSEIARRSGVSKANLYRYFESREEILFCLFIEELRELVGTLESGRSKSFHAIAALIVGAHVQRPLYCQLLGMVASILEHNLSTEVIALGKAELRVLGECAGAAMFKALPWLSTADAAFAVQAIALFVASLWPAAHPSKAATEALRKPELAAMKPDFERALTRFVEVLLAGLESVG